MDNRHIVLDTETTGFEPLKGDRLVEIGCIELINHVPSDKAYFHCFLNPERDMPEGAYRVHKLSSEFLKDKPLFKSVAQDFLDFIQDDPLIIHNAEFDMGFINAELMRAGYKALNHARAIDTLMMARKRFPGLKNSLDALCDRFHIDRSGRADAHGAIIDCQLLADVYLELIGGRQRKLDLDAAPPAESRTASTASWQAADSLNNQGAATSPYANRAPKGKGYGLSADAEAEHQAFLTKIGAKAWV